MKAAKIKKTNIKQEKIDIEEEYSVKKMATIIVILLIIFGIFYLITDLVVKPNKNQSTDNNITEIDYKKITLNNLLNRNEAEYYVLATMKSLYYKQSNYDDIYQKYIDDYSSRENSLPIYNVDLDDALNKNFVSSDLNISDNIEDLKLNDEVLFKIKDGKIEKYSVGNKQIIEQLSNL